MTAKKLRRLGFYRELSYGDKNGESLQDAVANASLEDFDRVVSYLRAGVPWVVAPGVSRDILSTGHEIIGSLALLTDGEFLWPSDLYHYVGKYKLALPIDFLRHVEINDWKVPVVDITVLEV